MLDTVCRHICEAFHWIGWLLGCLRWACMLLFILGFIVAVLGVETATHSFDPARGSAAADRRAMAAAA